MRNTQRIESFDILKGIGIILMILGHTYGPDTKIFDFISSFHMPLFFIVTGYFYKQESFPILLKKNIGQLLFPYLACCVITIVITQIRLPHNITTDIRSTINGMGPGWFLLAMFLARLEIHFTLKYFPNYYLIISLIIATTICHFAYNHGIPFFLSFFPSLVGLFFISIGYYIRIQSLLEFAKKRSSLYLIVGLLFWLTTSIYGKVEMSGCIFKLSIIDFCGSLGGTLLFFMLSQFFDRSNYRIKPILSNAGRYSLVILFFHSIDYCVSIWYYCVPIWDYINLYLPHSVLILLILLVRLLFVTVCVFITLKVKFLRKFFNIK